MVDFECMLCICFEGKIESMDEFKIKKYIYVNIIMY